MKKLFAISICAALLLPAINLIGDDWPYWRGPAKDGISPDKGWNPAGIKKKVWEKNVGVGYSAVAVVGDRLYTMGNKDKKDIVVCLNADTGDEIWKFSYPCGTGGGYAGPRATPVVDDGKVYTLSNEGDVHCIDAEKGKKILVQNGSELGAKNIKWKYSGSPCVERDMVIVNAGERGMAFDKKSGKVIWKSNGMGGYSTPVVFELKGKKYVAIFSKNTFQIANLKDGSSVTSTPWQTSYDVNACEPIVEGDKIFITSGYKNAGAVFQFNGSSLKQIWKNKNLKCQFNTPILYKGYLYGADGNTGKGNFVCVSFKDGKEKWRDKKAGYGSLVISDDKIIYLNDKGRVMIGKCSPSSFKPTDSGNVLSDAGKCWTMPVMINKKLYCRGANGKLICLDMN